MFYWIVMLNILVIQLDASRMVTGTTARCSSNLLNEDVGWPALASCRRAHRLTFFIIKLLMDCHYHQFVIPTCTRTYALSSSFTKQFHIRNMPSCTLCKIFIPTSIVEWNKLNDAMKGSTGLSGFKYHINLSIRRP